MAENHGHLFLPLKSPEIWSQAAGKAASREGGFLAPSGRWWLLACLALCGCGAVTALSPSVLTWPSLCLLCLCTQASQTFSYKDTSHWGRTHPDHPNQVDLIPKVKDLISRGGPIHWCWGLGLGARPFRGHNRAHYTRFLMHQVEPLGPQIFLHKHWMSLMNQAWWWRCIKKQKQNKKQSKMKNVCFLLIMSPYVVVSTVGSLIMHSLTWLPT